METEKVELKFEQAETKKLLSKLDLEFFLKLHIENRAYKQDDIDQIYVSLNRKLTELRKKAKGHEKQFFYYLESQVRRIFYGGFLPSILGLDDGFRYSLIDFSAVGESWAYFNYWQKYQRRKVTNEKVWNIIIKTGSVLAIVLSLFKLLEYTKIF